MKPGSTGLAARWRPAVADPRPEPAPFKRLALETAEPTAFGSGFMSGVASAVLGIAGFGIVLALRFPQAFGYAELGPLRSLAYLQAAIHVTLVTSFLLGTASAWLRTNKTLALTGIGFTLAAALLGGSRVAGSGDAASAWLGVDFFVLNLVLYSVVFVPLERLFALRPEQPVFRRQWPVDLTYFFINSLLIEVLTILTLKPAVIFFDWARVEWVRGRWRYCRCRLRFWHCCW